MNARRGIVLLSLGGMASMVPVALLQAGVVRHLPDPPAPGFDSDRVNLSSQAYPLGIPDGPLTMASFAGNLVLAGLGDAPPAVFARALKSMIDALLAGWHLYLMPARERAWCSYCLVAVLASLGIAGLAVGDLLQMAGERTEPFRIDAGRWRVLARGRVPVS
ncbi:MAG TPA: vitamin K epoxide reductase family protein [Chloroflexota bacterium]|jgi:uncharacterized membrane protein